MNTRRETKPNPLPVEYLILLPHDCVIRYRKATISARSKDCSGLKLLGSFINIQYGFPVGRDHFLQMKFFGNRWGPV